MSKYKVGDKFLVKVTGTEETQFETLYYLNHNSNLFCEGALDGFQQIKGIIPNEKINEIKTQYYEAGMNDAWAISRKLCLETEQGGMSDGDYYNVFGVDDIESALVKFTAQEAKAKIEAWEKGRKEIKVGDVVVSTISNVVFIVLRLCENEEYIEVMQISPTKDVYVKGHTARVQIRFFKKTGKHFDLSQIFALAGKNDGKIQK